MVLHQTFPRKALIICFLNFLHLAVSKILDYPVANLSANWIQRVSAPSLLIDVSTNTKMTTVLVRQRSGMAYACGFLCSNSCYAFLFGVVILPIENDGTVFYKDSPQVIWLANRNNPIRINSTLEFTSNSNLILKDSDGSIVWSTNTGGRSIAGINMTETGNLILFNANGSVVWQSFDHPIDTLVPGQQLQKGQKLIASISNDNYTEGIYSCLVMDDGAHFYIGSNPPLEYLRLLKSNPNNPGNFTSNRLTDYYLRLEPDGHLRKHYLGSEWGTSTEMFADIVSDCEYPMACGKYGLCQDGQCSCLLFQNASTRYFQQIDSRRPNLGCSPVTAIDCNAASYHRLVKVEHVMYFTFLVDISPIDRSGCMKACLTNCSCKLAIFRYEAEPSNGDCYLPSEFYSLRGNSEYSFIYQTNIFVKVQIEPSETSINHPNAKPASSRHSLRLIFGLAFGAMALVAIAMAFIAVKIRGRLYDRETEDNSFDSCAHGMPTRFSLDEMKIATDNFSVKLGEGGFGSVFQGSLKDGTKIAVKCLDGVGPANNSFLAEVASIGNIHHVNLVRLIGYSSETSQRLLVYEYMTNGSLDNWIDSRKHKFPLSWECKKQIVFDIAKGLAYLHEDCRQKIVHLDVKPENILLGENFEAKLSDFGMSKLLSRGQSKVFTTMRGTPGYLAPEWLSSIVTEKADVYSFGIVIMEILCGRKVIDESQPEDQVHLLNVFTQKAREGKWLDMVDKSCEDMISNGAEVLKLMQVAVWCLQNDFLVRPAMSVVVKVLEGVTDIDLTHLEYNFIVPSIFMASLPQLNNMEQSQGQDENRIQALRSSGFSSF